MSYKICRAAGRGLAFAAAIAIIATGTAFAAYPEKAIRLVVPFTPGGGTDAAARIVGDAMTGLLGQQIVVENKPGAAGNIALDAVAKAAPDGYTLLLGFGSSLTVNPSLYKSMPADVQKDLAPISTLSTSEYMLVVNPTLKVKSVAELVAKAKAEPGKLNYASGGNGTPLHLGSEMLKKRAGIDMVHIVYRGGGPAAKSVIANETQVLFASFPSSLSHVKAGSLTALASTGPKRSRALPDLPTMEESGYPGFIVTSWTSILAPAGTPKPVIDKLHAAIEKALAMESVRTKIEAVGQSVAGSTPEGLATLIKEDLARWRKVVQDAGIKPE
ncbi:MAG: Bug family tripartite tricarboxylate transporter substrate binding protein [Alphaproteobacteria bacterium]